MSSRPSTNPNFTLFTPLKSAKKNSSSKSYIFPSQPNNINNNNNNNPISNIPFNNNNINNNNPINNIPPFNSNNNNPINNIPPYNNPISTFSSQGYPPVNSFSYIGGPYIQKFSSPQFDNQLFNPNDKFNYYGRINNSQNISSPFTNNNIYEFNNNNNVNPNNIIKDCYIQVTGFDPWNKPIFEEFLFREGIANNDIKILGNEKIIVTFHGNRQRDQFLNNYQNVKEQFVGVEISYMDENDYQNVINCSNNITKARGINGRENDNYGYGSGDYDNCYGNNGNERVALPQQKTGWQKFLDVFLNL